MTYIPKGTKRHWTAEEESLLAESWGVCGIPALTKKLNRSQQAIKIRASRLHLGPLLMGGDYVTLNQLVTAFNRTGSGWKTVGCRFTTSGCSRTHSAWSISKSFGHGPRKTVHFWISPSWNRWRSVKNPHGWPSSESEISKPAPSSGKTRGLPPRMPSCGCCWNSTNTPTSKCPICCGALPVPSSGAAQTLG